MTANPNIALMDGGMYAMFPNNNPANPCNGCAIKAEGRECQDLNGDEGGFRKNPVGCYSPVFDENGNEILPVWKRIG